MPGQGPRPGAAGQPEQHGLGLVVAGVAEQHRRRPGLVRHLLQRGVAGAAGGRFRAAGPGKPVHGHPDLPHRVEAQGAQARRDPVRLGRRALLQAVVHGHAAAAQPQPGCLVGQGGGQGQRIGAA